MQHAGARRLREDDYAQEQRRDGRPDLKLVEGERRTVVITGHPVPPRRRRPAAAQQIEARPDRVALWAFLLALFLVFVAVATANAAV
jgi:hypothetical protein